MFSSAHEEDYSTLARHAKRSHEVDETDNNNALKQYANRLDSL